MAEGNISRRALFRGLIRPPEEPAGLRPPGALPEPRFRDLCSRCGDCVQACPKRAIYVYTEEADGELPGTPLMIPDERACHMCDGFPCVAACEPGALVIPDAPTWPLGTVRIDERRCIAFAGPECGACVGLCPGGLDAMRQERWRPKVDREQCVGCGICVEACPTTPSAILFEPRPD